jgi:hypothetical protein
MGARGLDGKVDPIGSLKIGTLVLEPPQMLMHVSYSVA